MLYEVPPERVDELVDVIGQAFSRSPDPPSDYVFELEPDPQLFKERLFSALGKACPPSALRQASSEKMEAISIWFPPGVSYPDDDESELFDPAEFQSPETPKRIAGMLRSIGATIRKLGSEPQWYLHVLATRPEHQGKGHTSVLMRSILARADEEGLPCTLVCPRHNIPVYEHFGFKVVDETQFADSDLFVYNMRREPLSGEERT